MSEKKRQIWFKKIKNKIYSYFLEYNGKWTLFNRNRGQIIDNGYGLQTYGYSPLYMMAQITTQKPPILYHMVYIRSSSAMDIIKSDNSLVYKFIGGIFDFRFFLSETPELLMSKFSSYLGKSEIPPFWFLGFHQSRRGYSDVSALEKVIEGYQRNGLPLDAIWSDIDYMINYQDFTFDQSRFPLDRMAKITSKYHYIPVIGGGIRINGTAYIEGKKRQLFIKDVDGSDFHGQSWAGNIAFVDFFHPNASQYWEEMLDSLYSKIKFSGIWLTNNQYSNFCDGPCEPQQSSMKFDYSKDLPYNPGNDPIQSKTIPLNSVHYGNRKEADVHVFNGFLQTYATHSFFKSKNMRPFVVSRSTTLGSNKYGFHWTGDNQASFQSLKGSIADIILNQLWGLHMSGADICGFGGNTNEQLCSRWFQLGALYPFARNHNNIGNIDQQPYALGDKVLEAAKTNLKLRYSLLKHYYSLFILKKGYGGIIIELFYVFSQNFNLYVYLAYFGLGGPQFLIGENIMAAPICQEGKTKRQVYFTTIIWYDLYTGKAYFPIQKKLQQIQEVKLTDKVPLFIASGTMILTQNTDNVRSTKDLNNVFILTAGFMKDKTSNQTHQYFSSAGTHISLKDYNDNAKIDICLSLSCEYIFNLLLSQSPQSKTLTLNINYVGATHLNEEMKISEVKLYTQSWILIEKLEKEIIINGNSKIVLPLGSDINRKKAKIQVL